MAKHFFQYSQIFSIFIYNESFPMKSYQFFKIYKRFYEKREKTVIQQSMRKDWAKLKFFKWQLIIFSSTDLFVHMIIIIIFYFASLFTAQFLLFDFRMTLTKVHIWRLIKVNHKGNFAVCSSAHINLHVTTITHKLKMVIKKSI